MAAAASLAAGFLAALVSPTPGAHAAEPTDQLGSLPVSGELLDEVTDSATEAVTTSAVQAAQAASAGK
ncbi:hypothetical protein [Streptomyces sp. NPDC058657]|uniref:hypothetical protein n=1 Tax=unclassified Streptomyces TaxID=2593676 RepID=UPI0036684EBF